MKIRPKIQTELVHLRAGAGLLRLTETQTGLTLEKILDAKRPVLQQKHQLLAALKFALQSQTSNQLGEKASVNLASKNQLEEISAISGRRRKRLVLDHA
jgi:hypothetical protein